MKQTPMSIYDFKKGDLITRIQPSKPIPGLEEEDIRDRAYIGIALIFLGVANGCVYVERDNRRGDEDEMTGIGGFFKMMMQSSGPINLPLDMWDEGWSYYVDPYSLSKPDIFNESLTKYEINELEDRLKEALKNEDYKKADILQKRIDKIKK